MKKKKILFLLFLFAIGLTICYPIHMVRADSGWDSDYSSDSSYDSGGSYHTHDHDYGSDSGDGISLPFAVVFLVLMVIGVILTITSLNYTSKKTPKRKIGEKNDEVAAIFPGYDEITLIREFYQIFIHIQEAWMNFDYETLERLCADELYQSYYLDLEALKEKHGQNIMSNFTKREGYVNSIEKVDNKYYVNISLSVSFYDYVIDTEINEVVRGNKEELMYNTYSLTYVIDEDKISELICPNCGAIVDSKKCSYCKSNVITPHHHFMLIKKSRS